MLSSDLRCVQTDATTPNIVGRTVLGVVASVLAVVCKRMQQLPTILGPAVHRGKDTTHKTLETMCLRGPNNVGRASAVQTDPTLLRYASTITVQKKCWELWAQTFDRFQTCNRVCKRTQHVTSNNGEFTRRQRWQQREWQKSNRFRH